MCTKVAHQIMSTITALWTSNLIHGFVALLDSYTQMDATYWTPCYRI